LVTQGLWAAIHGITSLMLQRPAYPWAAKAKVIEHLIATSLAGMGADPAPRDATVGPLQTSVA
jgi:hypothetical protein